MCKLLPDKHDSKRNCNSVLLQEVALYELPYLDLHNFQIPSIYYLVFNYTAL